MRAHRLLPVLVVAVVTAALGATPAAASSPSRAARSGAARPGGPAATIAGPLTGGQGLNLASATATTAPKGWVLSEYSAAGTATSYTSDGPLPADGHFSLQPGTTAPYKTRIVVMRPKNPKRFNGTAVVEWLNVSGGLDAAPDLTYMRPEILRRGFAWVGVSAQMIGIEGGPVAVRVPAADAAGAGKGLKTIDPARYGDLSHPGDAYSYDIFTQVARAIEHPKGTSALGPLRPKRVLAVGESQSAFALTTYVDGVQPLTRAFDGFVIHSRGGAAMPLGEPGQGIDVASSIGGAAAKLRTDGRAPIIVVQTETDILGVLGAYPARQADSARLRWWETAGTAHADRYIVGSLADSLGCAAAVNDGPGRFPPRAALHDLDRWVRGGTPPPKAPRLAVDTATQQYVRDQLGIAKGGIRTPLVDTPVDVLSGASPGGSIACILFGSTKPLTTAQLQARYPSRADYLREYRAATQKAIAAGFVLPADRGELLSMAQPQRIPA
jgi:hypothetical protein